MEKLQLNKRTIAQMDRMQMRNVRGGICIVTCKNASIRTRNCCRGAERRECERRKAIEKEQLEP